MKLTTMISRFLILVKETSRLHFNDQNFFKSKIIVFEIKGGYPKPQFLIIIPGTKNYFLRNYCFHDSFLF